MTAAAKRNPLPFVTLVEDENGTHWFIRRSTVREANHTIENFAAIYNATPIRSRVVAECRVLREIAMGTDKLMVLWDQPAIA